MSTEQTLFKGSPSLLSQLGTFLLCGILVAAGVALGFLYSPVWLSLAGVALVFGLGQWIVIKARVYEVTTERVRLTTGILTRRTDDLELYRVKDVTLIEPFLLRILSLGTIEMSTHDTSTPVLALEAISGARELREQLRTAIETCRDRKRVRLAEME